MTQFWVFLDETYAGPGFILGFFVAIAIFATLIRWRDARRGMAPQTARTASTQAPPPAAPSPAGSPPRCERCGAECPACTAYPPRAFPDLENKVRGESAMGGGAAAILQDAGMLPAFREHLRRIDAAVATSRALAQGKLAGVVLHCTPEMLLRWARIGPDGRVLEAKRRQS